MATKQTANCKSPKLKECDLVMKGGIASGIVYPQAILALQKQYRFRNIGGGSVGALAAALTAAAELGRECGGFAKLEQEQKKLREEGFLRQLFRPSEITKPLMNTVFDLKSSMASVGNDRRDKSKWQCFIKSRRLVSKARGVRGILKSNCPKAYRKGKLLGAGGSILAGAAISGAVSLAVGFLLYLSFFVVAGRTASSLTGWLIILPLLLVGPIVVQSVLFGIVGYWLLGPLGATYELFQILTKKMPKNNYYGACIGSGLPGTAEQPLLTDWICTLLDDLANLRGEGFDEPLTFRHLHDAAIPDKNPSEAGISLRMLTTNLNHHEPYVFPKETNTFLFCEKDMRRFFPGYVVDYMVNEGKKVASRTCVRLPENHYFLPRGLDLPVVVPVRMGVSFPGLLSAVPLYTISESAWADYAQNPKAGFNPEKDFQLNLFSDGGICSNFPIHFFDEWLPRRPTFGINLTSVPAGDSGEGFSVGNIKLATDEADRESSRASRIDDLEEPWLPNADDLDSREWKEIQGIRGFFSSIFGTAMRFRDNMQSRLPSYQERIVQVSLKSHEGGLNLDMKTDVIEAMENKGIRAGDILLQRFTDKGFRHHRWVRLRVLLSELETRLKGMHEALDSVLQERLADLATHSGYPYPYVEQRMRTKRVKRFLKKLQKLTGELEKCQNECFPAIPNEDPQPTLRITPDV